MLPYWFLFAIFAVGTIRSDGIGYTRGGNPNAVQTYPGTPELARRGTPLLAIAALFTAAMIGLRFEVGADWETYLIIYRVVGRLGPIEAMAHWEPGYVLINAVAERLDTGVWLVNLICGLIFMYGIVQFARGQPNPWLAILVGVPYLIIGVAMGYTRQAVAIGCCMAGFAALTRGSFWKMALWVLAGAMFHRTAIVVLPLVLLSYTRSVLQTLLVAVIGGYVGYKLLSANIGTYQYTYISRVYESQGSGVRLAMNLPPAIIFLLLSQRFQFSKQERELWRNFSLAAVLSFLIWLATSNTVVVDRLALYLIPLQLVVLSRLPNALSNSETPSGEYKALVIFYCFFVQFTWLNFANHAKYWVPYKLYPFS